MPVRKVTSPKKGPARFDHIEYDVTWLGETRRGHTAARAWENGEKIFKKVVANFLAGTPDPSGGPYVEERKGEQGLNLHFTGFRVEPCIARRARPRQGWGYNNDGWNSTHANKYLICAHLLRAAKYGSGAPDCKHEQHGTPGHVCEAIVLHPLGQQKAPSTARSHRRRAANNPPVMTLGQAHLNVTNPEGHALEPAPQVPPPVGNPADNPSPFLADQLTTQDLQSDDPLRRRPVHANATEAGIGPATLSQVLQDLGRTQTEPVLVHYVHNENGADIVILKNWKGDEAHRILHSRNRLAGTQRPAAAPAPGAYLKPPNVASYFIAQVGGQGAGGSDVIKDLGPWGTLDPRLSPDYGQWQDCWNALHKSLAFKAYLQQRGYEFKALTTRDALGRTVERTNAHGDVMYVVEEIRG